MTSGAALVVDASAVIEAVLNPSGPGRMARSLMASAATHAPHLIDAEVGHVLRRRALARDLQTEVAFERLGLAHRLVTTRHEMSGALSGLAWRLLDEVTFDDAL